GMPGFYAGVLTLAIDPRNPATLFAGTQRGLFKSLDGGASWSAANSGLPTLPGATMNLAVSRIAINPEDRNTVYAVSQNTFSLNGRLVCCSAEIFKSVDAGASWSQLNAPPDLAGGSFPPPIVDLTIDPKTPNTLYATRSCTCPPVESDDGGATWRILNGTLPSSIRKLALDSKTRTLYAGTVTSGLFKRTDDGARWVPVPDLPSGGIGPFEIDPGNSGIYYVEIVGRGLFETSDGGEHWTNVSAGLSTSYIAALAADPENPGTIYAA